jgi:hypothetical protein
MRFQTDPSGGLARSLEKAIVVSRRIRRPRKLNDDQENGVIDMILVIAKDFKFVSKRESLDEIENRYGKVLTDGWLHEFLLRNQDQITCATIHP